MKPLELKADLNRIVTSSIHNPVTFDGSVICHLNRWLVTSSLGDKNLFELFPLYNKNAKVLSSKDVGALKTEEVEKNWRFYISEDKSSFYKRNLPEKLFSTNYDRKREKYVYCLSSVYCLKKMTLSIHISTNLPTPIKAWINGQLVFMGTIENFSKDYINCFPFEKGINTVLIEKPICAGNRRLSLIPKWFSICVRPMSSVVNNALAIAINQKQILDKHFSNYTIYTDKLFYNIKDNIKMLILSHSNQSKFDVCIELYYPGVNIVRKLVIQIGKIYCIPLDNLYDSLIKITIIDSNDSSYVFCGDYERYCANIQKKIQHSGLLPSHQISLLYNLKILDKDKGFIINSIEPIHKYYSQPIFSKLFLFEEQIHSDRFDYHIHNGFNVFISPIDQAYFTYYLQISIQSDDVSVPLVVCFSFDDSSTKIPTAPNRVLTEELNQAVILTFCSRGDYRNDFINEFEIVSVIRYIINQFPINKKSIHFFGICTGARRGFDFINKYSNTFASMFSFLGTPTEQNTLTDTNTTYIYQLYSLDDSIYNGATVHKNAINIRDKGFYISGFEHEELIDYYCHKNTFDLILQHNLTTKCVLEELIVNDKAIKSIYLDVCKIVFGKLEKNDLLSTILTQPLKSRVRNYHFPIIKTSQLVGLVPSNLIVVGSLDEYRKFFPAEILSLALLLTQEFHFKEDDDFFLISLEKNPFNYTKKILFIVYSGILAPKELICLWERFDFDPKFNYRQVIYLNGNYLDQ